MMVRFTETLGAAGQILQCCLTSLACRVSGTLYEALCAHMYLTQVTVLLTARLVLLLLQVSTVNHSHLQGVTDVEGMYSVLHRLFNINCKMFIHTGLFHKCTVL